MTRLGAVLKILSGFAHQNWNVSDEAKLLVTRMLSKSLNTRPGIEEVFMIIESRSELTTWYQTSKLNDLP
jgi:hypothetical protein